MGAMSRAARARVLAVFIVVALLLAACGVRGTATVQGPATAVRGTAVVARHASGGWPDVAGTVIAMSPATPTPAPGIRTPAGLADFHGVVTSVTETMVLLDQLRDRSRYPDRSGLPPYMFSMSDKPSDPQHGNGALLGVDGDTRVFRQEGSRLVPAKLQDLEIGQRIAVRLAGTRYPDLIVIREGPPVNVNPPGWPEEIITVTPGEGETRCARESVWVEMYLHEVGRKEGGVEQSKLNLVFDEVDITSDN